MKNILNVYKWKAIKRGFFGGETLKGEYMMFSIEDENIVYLFQFMEEYKPGLYVAALEDAFQTPDYDVVQDFYDQLNLSADIEVLERDLKIKVKTSSSGKKVTLVKPSKYLGKTIEIMNDSRLSRGYFMIKANLKQGVQPAVSYKKSRLVFAKKMRAYSSARLPKPKTKENLKSDFLA